MTVGQQFRQARQTRSLTLEQVAQATRIRPHYLEALEDDDFSALPSVVQGRGFIRAYASFLKLDGEAMLAILDGNEPPTSTPPPPTPKPPAPQSNEKIEAPSVEPAPDSALHPPAAITSERGPQLAVSPQQTSWEPMRPIFVDIGKQLQRQRELLGLSLEDVERHTHLRRHYLQAIENGDMQGLPSPVQGRGMLNNYATFLGLNPEPLMMQFAEGLQMSLAARREIAQEQSASRKPQHNQATDRSFKLPAPLRRFFSVDMLIGLTLGIFLMLFIAWGSIRIFSMQSAQVSTLTQTAPSIAEVLLASPTPTVTFTPAPPTATSPIPPALQIQNTASLPPEGEVASGEGQEISDKVQIYINITQRTWLRVIVDGKTEMEGRVIPGAYTFVGEAMVEILTGNGAAVEVYYNQRNLGAMGLFGQVVNKIYTLQGVADPTPTPAPTGEPSLLTTATPVAPGGASATAPTLP